MNKQTCAPAGCDYSDFGPLSSSGGGGGGALPKISETVICKSASATDHGPGPICISFSSPIDLEVTFYDEPGQVRRRQNVTHSH